MAFKISEAYVEITARLDKLDAQMKAGGPASQTVEKGASELGQRFSRAFGQVLGAIGVTVGVAALVRGLKSMVAAAMEEELSQTRLRAALLLTKDATEETVAQALNFSQAMMGLVPVTHEEVEAGMAFAATLGVSRDRLEEVVRIGMGLATVFGQDMRGGIELATRAAQGSFVMFSRYGLVLEGLTTEQKWQKIAELGSKGFDILQKSAETAAGQTKRLRIELGELQEDIGARVLPTLSKAAEGLRLLIQGPPSPEKRAGEFGFAGDSPAMTALTRRMIAVRTRLQEAQEALREQQVRDVSWGRAPDSPFWPSQGYGPNAIPTAALEEAVTKAWKERLAVAKKMEELTGKESAANDMKRVSLVLERTLTGEVLRRYEAERQYARDQQKWIEEGRWEVEKRARLEESQGKLQALRAEAAEAIVGAREAAPVPEWRSVEARAWAGWTGQMPGGNLGLLPKQEVRDPGVIQEVRGVREELQGLRQDLQNAPGAAWGGD